MEIPRIDIPQIQIKEIYIPKIKTWEQYPTTLDIIDKPKIALNKTKPKRSLIVIASTIMSLIMSLLFIYTDHRTKDFRQAIKQNKL